jgi:hypothetical protein
MYWANSFNSWNALIMEKAADLKPNKRRKFLKIILIVVALKLIEVL